MSKDIYRYRNVQGGRIESKWNTNTYRWEETGFVPYEQSRAESLARDVRSAEQAWAAQIGAAAGGVAAVSAMVATAGGEVIGNIASNPDLVHLAQNAGQYEGAACAVAPIIFGATWLTKRFLHRRATRVAREISRVQPANPLPELELSRALHSTIGCGTTVVNAAATVTAGSVGAAVGTALGGVAGPEAAAAAATATYVGLRILEGASIRSRIRAYWEAGRQLRRQRRYRRAHARH